MKEAPEKSGPDRIDERWRVREENRGADMAKRLIEDRQVGVLTTVDPEGQPHARWMATLATEDFPLLYTLTAPDSRKVKDILIHPRVEWMFSSEDMTFVVNLMGHARVIHDTVLIKRVWREMKDKSRAFFLNSFTERPGFAVIETAIERIEGHYPAENRGWSEGTALG